jgi:cytidylate kinase
MSRSIILSENIRPILASIKTVPIPAKLGEEPPKPALPFVTLSREVGAGAWTLAQRLAESLSQSDPGEQLWTCWDRELVEKVASDHRLSTRLIESLEESSHSWLGDFFSSLRFADDPANADELTVFHGVAKTIRALAQAGRVIIVGRGGVFLTRRMRGGVHIRLVAPLATRIEHMRQHLNVSRDEAVRQVQELTRRREAFYKRYWPGEPIRPELFTAVLNTEAVSQEGMVAVIEALVRQAAAVNR